MKLDENVEIELLHKRHDQLLRPYNTSGSLDIVFRARIRSRSISAFPPSRALWRYRQYSSIGPD